MYNQNLKVFKELIEKAAVKNNNTSILMQVEHFENQFIVQKENFDILNHEIKAQERKIREDLQGNPINDDIDILNDQTLLRDKIHIAEKIFIALKHDFHNFVARALQKTDEHTGITIK